MSLNRVIEAAIPMLVLPTRLSKKRITDHVAKEMQSMHANDHHFNMLHSVQYCNDQKQFYRT
uniref:AlNc14C377G11180 protein n=1 Tax=Albugo laibachii Nc14 TaxID=890382 RepID=F0WYC1_9STRA|nr:AlNc14C377G11180 [Albugo laibachii Nc14]|eukprot:CCA26473.1 AlNc14C377G11180 [Albugo laibachii Nc14]